MTSIIALAALCSVVMATGSQRFGVHFLPVRDEVQYCILKDSGAVLLCYKRLRLGSSARMCLLRIRHLC